MWIGCFWSVWHFINGWDRVERVFKVVPIIGAITLWLSFGLFAMGWEPIVQASGRFAGILGNPNTVGSLFGMSLPGMFYVAITAFPRRSLFWLVTIWLGIAFLFMSGSRAGAACAGVGLLTVMLMCRKQKGIPRVAISVVMGGILSGLTVFFRGSGLTLFARLRGGINLEKRLELWRQAFSVIRHSPILGHGFGVANHLHIVDPYNTHLRAVLHMGPHNSILSIGIDLGVVGIVLILLCILFVVQKGLILLKLHQTGKERLLVAALLSTIFAGVVNGLFESWWVAAGSIEGLIFWVSAAVITRLVMLDRNAAK